MLRETNTLGRALGRNAEEDRDLLDPLHGELLLRSLVDGIHKRLGVGVHACIINVQLHAEPPRRHPHVIDSVKVGGIARIQQEVAYHAQQQRVVSVKKVSSIASSRHATTQKPHQRPPKSIELPVTRRRPDVLPPAGAGMIESPYAIPNLTHDQWVLRRPGLIYEETS